MRQPAQVCEVLALKNAFAPCACAGAFFIARAGIISRPPSFLGPGATGK
ncbi:MAG: hypothetical protein RLZZ603_704 [Actinomycetota bacterium]|jgi:hypothetical protein